MPVPLSLAWSRPKMVRVLYKVNLYGNLPSNTEKIEIQDVLGPT